MRDRLHSLLCLSLLLVSCDKQKQTGSRPSPSIGPTKTERPASPHPREPLRTALRKADAIASPAEKNSALAAAIWEAVDLEPELAREALSSLTPGTEEKNRLIQHFAMRLAEADEQQAIQWASAQETEDEKSLAFAKIALVISENEPERAARLLSDSGIAGREFDVAVVQVVQRWALRSPVDAAAWVTLFDPGEARSAGLKEILSVWSRNDPPAAFAWIVAQENDQIRQEAEAGILEVVLEQPESDREGLLELATPAMRDSFEALKVNSAE